MNSRTYQIVFLLVLLPILALVAAFTYFYHEIARDTASHIEKGAIREIIFSESPVYCDDGESVIGVFFEKTHRKYIRYEQIPSYFIKALIASEDGNFFRHPGFDIKAIARALVANLKAGKVVQGGSTITQQTAKNVFKRQKRSYRAKFQELVQALLLESRYTKEEILEMYVNQFFVTGFGSGLGIAARYYFDRDPEELDLVECAFIAGSVKAPDRYNPFTKKTQAERQEARRLARLRKDYVLSNMLLLNFITEEQFLEARAREVPFREGDVTYRLNVVLDYVREQLESDFFRAILQEQGIDNIATSGIRIYTSVNREIQEGALRSLRKHLPLLDARLTGFDRTPLQERYRALEAAFPRAGPGDLPFLCRITQLIQDKDRPRMLVAWEGGGGIIDFEGLRPLGEAWLKGELGEWAVFDKTRVPAFLGQFRVGDLVAVQVQEGQAGGDQAVLALSKIPELEGGIVVLRHGMVKAMVGGFRNRYFNRASEAKRQLGSIFKPLVYTAALQLKWNGLDSLLNRRDLFRFENTFYFPRPDHEPHSEKVSMAWAGVKSENLATVRLLFNLTDRLNLAEFRQVMHGLGLDSREEESYRDYAGRIRDAHGVVVNKEALMEAAFEASKRDLEADLIFGGYEEALDTLARLHFNVDTKALNLKHSEEYQVYRMSFQRLRALNFEMKRDLQRVKTLSRDYGRAKDTGVKQALSSALRYFYIGQPAGGKGPRVIYTVSPHKTQVADLRPVTPEWVAESLAWVGEENVWLDGVLPSKVIDLLQLNVKRHYERLSNHRRYDPEVLFWIGDFRRLVNLHYVVRLSRMLGISSPLEPVLSFPLGGNAITLADAAVAYQSMLSGKRQAFAGGALPLITKIVDREGTVIWEYEERPTRVLSDEVAAQVSEILRLVVEKGTGQKARDAVRLSLAIDNQTLDLPIPCFGKTGTANDFTNSSFLGLIPAAGEDSGELRAEEGFVIGTYVGYDDNRPMKGKSFSVYGASGALPLWIETATAIANSPAYREHLQIADLAFEARSIPFASIEQLQPVMISSLTGLPITAPEPSEGEIPTEMLSYVEKKGERLVLKRIFEPIPGVSHEQAFPQ